MSAIWGWKAPPSTAQNLGPEQTPPKMRDDWLLASRIPKRRHGDRKPDAAGRLNEVELEATISFIGQPSDQCPAHAAGCPLLFREERQDA